MTQPLPPPSGARHRPARSHSHHAPPRRRAATGRGRAPHSARTPGVLRRRGRGARDVREGEQYRPLQPGAAPRACRPLPHPRGRRGGAWAGHLVQGAAFQRGAAPLQRSRRGTGRWRRSTLQGTRTPPRSWMRASSRTHSSFWAAFFKGGLLPGCKATRLTAHRCSPTSPSPRRRSAPVRRPTAARATPRRPTLGTRAHTRTRPFHTRAGPVAGTGTAITHREAGLTLALLACSRGHPHEACALLEGVLAQDPHDILCLRLLTDTYLALGCVRTPRTAHPTAPSPPRPRPPPVQGCGEPRPLLRAGHPVLVHPSAGLPPRAGPHCPCPGARGAHRARGVCRNARPRHGAERADGGCGAAVGPRPQRVPPTHPPTPPALCDQSPPLPTRCSTAATPGAPSAS